MKEKLKSPVVWGAILALFYFIAKDWIGMEIPEWDKFVSLFLAVGIGFGVLNNPDNKEGF